MAERIKMLFRVNTPGALVLDGVPDLSTERGSGSWGKCCQLWTYCISRERLKLELFIEQRFNVPLDTL